MSQKHRGKTLNVTKRSDRTELVYEGELQPQDSKERKKRIKSQDMEVGPESDEVWSTDGPSYALRPLE